MLTAQEEGASKLLSSLKQRILSFLWRRSMRLPRTDTAAMDTAERQERARDIRFLSYHFDELKALCMWRMQLLGEPRAISMHTYTYTCTYTLTHIRTTQTSGIC